MLHMMMEAKGRFPNKLLKKGMFSSNHFDEDDNFAFLLEKPVSKVDEQVTEISKRAVVIPTHPSKDIKSRIMEAWQGEESEKLLALDFSDFLEKALALVPERRITVAEALKHPFINPKIRLKS